MTCACANPSLHLLLSVDGDGPLLVGALGRATAESDTQLTADSSATAAQWLHENLDRTTAQTDSTPEALALVLTKLKRCEFAGFIVPTHSFLHFSKRGDHASHLIGKAVRGLESLGLRCCPGLGTLAK